MLFGPAPKEVAGLGLFPWRLLPCTYSCGGCWLGPGAEVTGLDHDFFISMYSIVWHFFIYWPFSCLISLCITEKVVFLVSEDLSQSFSPVIMAEISKKLATNSRGSAGRKDPSFTVGEMQTGAPTVDISTENSQNHLWERRPVTVKCRCAQSNVPRTSKLEMKMGKRKFLKNQNMTSRTRNGREATW